MPFSDHSIRITLSFYRAVALVLGALGVTCAVSSAWLFLSGAERIGAALAVLTVPLVAGAAVITIRSFCGVLNENLTEAFEMGREVGRDEVREGFIRPVR